MMLVKLSFKNLVDRPLRSMLSILLLTLGIAMISFVFVLGQQLNEQFKNNIKNTDMVVGAKGSPLQLILSAIYHIDAPTGNISIKEAFQVAKHPLVKSVIPMAYGDYYQGYRILGTNYGYPASFEATLAEGSWWSHPLEVCIGADVAKKLNIGLGDTFFGMHGAKEEGHVHEENKYRVVGILNRTNSVLDQLILTSVESVWQTHEHDHAEDHHHGHDHHGHHHDNGAITSLPIQKEWAKASKAFLSENKDKELTALLVKFRSPLANLQLPRLVNGKTTLQAALPAIEVTRLFDLLGIGMKLFQLLAWVIVITAGLSLFISLYNALKERKYELALMRAMGGSPRQLFYVILLEGQWVVLLGWVFGLIFSRLGILLFSGYAENEYNFIFDKIGITNEEYWLLLYCVAVGFVSALLPSLRILKLQIASVLSSGR